MKNFKNTIIVSLVTTVALAYGANFAAAEIVPNLSIAPSGTTKAVGQTFSASVVATTNASEIVYAAEGTIGFDNLTCKGISAAAGLMIQSMPTCANPHFVAGIPNGMNSSKTLFTVSVAGIAEGQGAITLSSVDVIGNGVSLSTNGTGATYTLSGTVIPEKQATTSPVVEIGADGQVLTQTDATTTDAVIDENTEATTTATTTVATKGTGLLAAVGESLYGIPSALVIVIGALLLALFGGLIYYRRSRPEEQI